MEDVVSEVQDEENGVEEVAEAIEEKKARINCIQKLMKWVGFGKCGCPSECCEKCNPCADCPCCTEGFDRNLELRDGCIRTRACTDIGWIVLFVTLNFCFVYYGLQSLFKPMWYDYAGNQCEKYAAISTNFGAYETMAEMVEMPGALAATLGGGAMFNDFRLLRCVDNCKDTYDQLGYVSEKFVYGLCIPTDEVLKKAIIDSIQFLVAQTPGMENLGFIFDIVNNPGVIWAKFWPMLMFALIFCAAWFTLIRFCIRIIVYLIITSMGAVGAWVIYLGYAIDVPEPDATSPMQIAFYAFGGIILLLAFLCFFCCSLDDIIDVLEDTSEIIYEMFWIIPCPLLVLIPMMFTFFMALLLIPSIGFVPAMKSVPPPTAATMNVDYMLPYSILPYNYDTTDVPTPIEYYTPPNPLNPECNKCKEVYDNRFNDILDDTGKLNSVSLAKISKDAGYEPYVLKFLDPFDERLVAILMFFYWNIWFWDYFCFTVLAGLFAEEYIDEKFAEASGAPSYCLFGVTCSFLTGWGNLGQSIWRVCRYHLGTIAFASCIMAIVSTIRAMAEYYMAQLEGENPTMMSRILIACVSCLLRCLEECANYCSKNSLIFTAIYGAPLMASCCGSLSMLFNNLGMMASAQILIWILNLMGLIVIVFSTWICSLWAIDPTIYQGILLSAGQYGPQYFKKMEEYVYQLGTGFKWDCAASAVGTAVIQAFGETCAEQCIAMDNCFAFDVLEETGQCTFYDESCSAPLIPADGYYASFTHFRRVNWEDYAWLGISVFIAYFCASAFLNIFETASSTLLICFLILKDHPDKPLEGKNYVLVEAKDEQKKRRRKKKDDDNVDENGDVWESFDEDHVLENNGIILVDENVGIEMVEQDDNQIIESKI